MKINLKKIATITALCIALGTLALYICNNKPRTFVRGAEPVGNGIEQTEVIKI